MDVKQYGPGPGWVSCLRGCLGARMEEGVRNRCTGGVSLGGHQYLGAPTQATLSAASLLPSDQSSGAVWESRWPSWAPVPNKPTVSVDVKQHLTTAYRPKGTWTYVPIQWPERCVSVKHISGMWYQLLLLFLTQPPAALPAINLQLIRFVLYNLLRCLKSICCKPNQLLRQLNRCVICFACSGTVASVPLWSEHNSWGGEQLSRKSVRLKSQAWYWRGTEARIRATSDFSQESKNIYLSCQRRKSESVTVARKINRHD